MSHTSDLHSIDEKTMAASKHSENMLNHSSIFVPFTTLTQPVVKSIVSVATTFRKPNYDLSERTILRFLLEIKKTLSEIESKIREDSTAVDQQLVRQAELVQQWLVNVNKQPLNWKELQSKYDKLANRNCDELARYYRSNSAEPYFELKIDTRYVGVLQSRQYIQRFRQDGFHPEELKLYWNVKQLENLSSQPSEHLLFDPSDSDAVNNLRQYPVTERHHAGSITYITNGIEKAVFDVPDGAQIILLNFANEQSPGGGYLRHARAQEEVLLYNSDAYRALLDLKYGRMNGGYAIPEFGLAYVRDIRIFKSLSSDEHRKADMLVSACYCLNGHELYQNPKNAADWQKKTSAKFRAFIAAAVANTVGDGKNTYLLLGPIGTGAFGNDVQRIGEVFHQVLESSMMGSTGPIRYAFAHIWFVSTDRWKNDVFRNIFTKLNSNV